MPERRLSLLQAVSLNMSLMVGIGPFITLPALVGTLGGPQSMIGWVLGGLVALADGMVWSELAAAFPGSGGTYHFYDAAYGSVARRQDPEIPVRLAVLLQRPARDCHRGDRHGQVSRAIFSRSCRQPAWNWGSVFPRSQTCRSCGARWPRWA